EPLGGARRLHLKLDLTRRKAGARERRRELRRIRASTERWIDARAIEDLILTERPPQPPERHLHAGFAAEIRLLADMGRALEEDIGVAGVGDAELGRPSGFSGRGRGRRGDGGAAAGERDQRRELYATAEPRRAEGEAHPGWTGGGAIPLDDAVQPGGAASLNVRI